MLKQQTYVKEALQVSSKGPKEDSPSYKDFKTPRPRLAYPLEYERFHLCLYFIYHQLLIKRTRNYKL